MGYVWQNLSYRSFDVFQTASFKARLILIAEMFFQYFSFIGDKLDELSAYVNKWLGDVAEVLWDIKVHLHFSFGEARSLKNNENS